LKLKSLQNQKKISIDFEENLGVPSRVKKESNQRLLRLVLRSLQGLTNELPGVVIAKSKNCPKKHFLQFSQVAVPQPQA